MNREHHKEADDLLKSLKTCPVIIRENQAATGPFYNVLMYRARRLGMVIATRVNSKGNMVINLLPEAREPPTCIPTIEGNIARGVGYLRKPQHADPIVRSLVGETNWLTRDDCRYYVEMRDGMWIVDDEKPTLFQADLTRAHVGQRSWYSFDEARQDLLSRRLAHGGVMKSEMSQMAVGDVLYAPTGNRIQQNAHIRAGRLGITVDTRREGAFLAIRLISIVPRLMLTDTQQEEL